MRSMFYTSFNPITEPISVQIKNSRIGVAGSLKNRMPRITVPTAPIPVHTGYAVLIGRVWAALASRTMLNVRQTIKHPPQR